MTIDAERELQGARTFMRVVAHMAQQKAWAALQEAFPNEPPAPLAEVPRCVFAL
ncbi:MAG: hypothetical protein H5T69_10885 [Chloroflexi bacterium]|nr:hypothetical protein [Chloroflexota bacterium]